MKGRNQAPSGGGPVGYQPPSYPEAEQSVLGAILVRPEVLDELVGQIGEEDFYREAHAKIFHAMMDLYKNNFPVDLVTVNTYLKEAGQLEGVGGPVFLAGLSEQVGFATNALYYSKIVRKKSLLRRLLDVTQEVAGACLAKVEDVDAFIDEAEEKIFRLKSSSDDGQEVFTLDDLIAREQRRIEDIYNRKQEVLGIPSGLIDLDRITSGWQNSDLIILAARPSMGKTALALNMSHYAAKVWNVPTVFFSMEQSKEQLGQRLMASTNEINAARLRSAKMEGEEWARFWNVDALENIPLFLIEKQAMSILEIRSRARRLVLRQKIGLIIVDYLQLAVQPGAKSREQEIGGISRALKALAKELNVPVIALSQLNRDLEKRQDKRPILSDLRESGSIEQDADVVAFIYRDEVYRADSKDKGVAEIIVAKQRNGPTGWLMAVYGKEYMKFDNYVGDKET